MQSKAADPKYRIEMLQGPPSRNPLPCVLFFKSRTSDLKNTIVQVLYREILCIEKYLVAEV